jgi:hypothetical protein
MSLSIKTVVNNTNEILALLSSFNKSKENIVLTTVQKYLVDENEAKKMIVSVFWRDYSLIYNTLKLIFRCDAFPVFDIILKYLYGDKLSLKTSDDNKNMSFVHDVDDANCWHTNNHIVIGCEYIGPVDAEFMKKMLKNSPLKKELYEKFNILRESDCRHVKKHIGNQFLEIKKLSEKYTELVETTVETGSSELDILKRLEKMARDKSCTVYCLIDQYNIIVSYYEHYIKKNIAMAKLSAFRRMELEIVRTYQKNKQIIKDNALSRIAEFIDYLGTKAVGLLVRYLCLSIYLLKNESLEADNFFSRTYQISRKYCTAERLCGYVLDRRTYCDAENIVCIEKIVFNIIVRKSSDEQKSYILRNVDKRKKLAKVMIEKEKYSLIKKKINEDVNNTYNAFITAKNIIDARINEKKKIKNKQKKERNKTKKFMCEDNFPVIDMS